MQEDIKNALALIDSLKAETKRNTDSINELSDNHKNSVTNIHNLINEIQKKIEQITTKINYINNYNNNPIPEKIESEEEEKNMLKKK